MSTPLHVLLKADPCLEGDVADGKADPHVFYQRGHTSFMQYFEGGGQLHGPPTLGRTIWPMCELDFPSFGMFCSGLKQVHSQKIRIFH